MLELRNIDAGYDRRLVLKNISVKLPENAITLIMGNNNSGKSTLLKVIYGLLEASAGEIYYNEVKFTPKPTQMVQNGIFFVPQGKCIFRNMTVLENMELATHFWKERYNFQNHMEKALSWFPDLSDRLDDLAGSLSRAKQVELALAGIMISQPKLVLLDKTSSGLTPDLISKIMEKVKDIHEKEGVGFVIVEHNHEKLLPIADNVYLLNQGEIVYGGSPKTKTFEKSMESLFHNNGLEE